MAKSSAPFILLGLGAVGVWILASSSSKSASAPTPGLRLKTIIAPGLRFPVTQQPIPQAQPQPQQPSTTSTSPTTYPSSTSSTGQDIQQGIQDVGVAVKTATDIYNGIQSAMNASGSGDSSSTSDGTDAFSTAQ